VVASLVSWVEPVYPVVARKDGVQGAVWLDAVIGQDGHVVSAQSISGNPALVDAAKDVVMQRVYRPTLLNGEPIKVIMKVCVAFVRRQSKQKPSPCAQTGGIH
jgi:protein TonB